MTTELLISLISLGISTFCSILTISVNLKVSKINNIEALHKYEKKITRFELSFKDEAWLVDLMQSGDFNNYDEESKQLIHQWWQEYSKEHEPTQAKRTLPNSRNFGGARFRLSSSSRRTRPRGR